MQRGAVVKQLTLVELVEMFQVMSELEGLCARLAARRMRLEQSKSLKEIQKIAAKRLSNREQNNFLQQESCSLRNRVNLDRRYLRTASAHE